MGDVDSALSHLEIAVAIYEAQPEPDLPALATSLGNLGMALRVKGEYPRAWNLCKRALKIDIAHFGPNHLTVGYAYNNLGQILKDLALLGRGHESEETLETWSEKSKEFFGLALEIFENTHQGDHPEIAMVLKNLGNLFDQQGDCPAARAHLERALAMAQQVYSVGHSFIKETMENLNRLDC
jgi:tetratricopeptide (TPR) repeat protein